MKIITLRPDQWESIKPCWQDLHTYYQQDPQLTQKVALLDAVHRLGDPNRKLPFFGEKKRIIEYIFDFFLDSVGIPVTEEEIQGLHVLSGGAHMHVTEVLRPHLYEIVKERGLKVYFQDRRPATTYGGFFMFTRPEMLVDLVNWKPVKYEPHVEMPKVIINRRYGPGPTSSAQRSASGARSSLGR